MDVVSPIKKSLEIARNRDFAVPLSEKDSGLVEGMSNAKLIENIPILE